MSIHPTQGADRRQSVLLVDERGIEWLSSRSDGERHTRIDVADPKAESIAEAATRASKEAGGATRRITLVLGEGLVQHRIVELPIAVARSARHELERTLQRKAAATLGCELGEAMFAAVMVDEGKEGRDDARPTTWLLAAYKQGVVLDLHRELRRRGLAVHRCASLRATTAVAADARRDDRNGASIVVVVERSCVTLTLVHGGLAFDLGLLRGSFQDEPQLAMALLQEIKSLDVHWRKQSRGESVSEILLLGFPKERGELFAGALGSAHRDMRVTVLSDQRPDTEHGAASRIELLRMCRTTSGAGLDLTPRARANRGRRLALAGAALALTAGIAWFGWSSSRELREDAARTLSDLQARGAELESLAARASAKDAALRELEVAIARGQEIQSAGIEVQSILAEVRSSLGSDAALLGMRLSPDESSTTVEIEGETTAQPIRAAANIARITRDLENSRVLAHVEVRSAPLPSSPNAPVRFRLSGRLETSP